MGFFNKLIYGNPNKPDLEVDDNPNPIKAFFEVLRIKLWDLIKLNLLFALFVIPAAIWTGINITVVIRAFEAFNESGAVGNFFLDGGYSSFLFYYILGMIPCLVIIGVALPSLNYITRSFAREFHVWMLEDFLEKIKENWKQSLLYMFLLGVAAFIMYISATFYAIEAANVPFYNILRGTMYVLAGIIIVSTNFVYPLMVTFELKFKQLVRNSFLLAFAKLPQTILILIVVSIIPVFLLWLTMVWNYGLFAFLGYLLLFGFSFSSFIINAYTNRIFEKIIIASGEAEADKKPDVERKDK